MNKFLRRCAIIAALSLAQNAATGLAAEVALNASTLEVDGSTTEWVERQQGPYVGLWLGAATNPYASTRGRIDGTHLEDDTGLAVGLKFGYFYRTPYFIRPSIEFELAYLSSDLTLGGSAEGRDRERLGFTGSSDIQAVIGTVNLVLALDLGSLRDQVGDFLASIHPYVGVGAGAAYSTVGNIHGKLSSEGGGSEKLRVGGGSKIGFAYQFIAGLEFELDEDLSVFGEYKRIGLENTGSSSVRDYETNLWVFGCKLAY